MNRNSTGERTVITIWVWITYLVVTVFYFVSFNLIEPMYSKNIFLWSSCLTLLYCSVDIVKGFRNELHRAFLSLCIASIALTLFFIILYYQFGFEDYKVRIGSFLGVETITVLFIFISGNKRGLF